MERPCGGRGEGMSPRPAGAGCAEPPESQPARDCPGGARPQRGPDQRTGARAATAHGRPIGGSLHGRSASRTGPQIHRARDAGPIRSRLSWERPGRRERPRGEYPTGSVLQTLTGPPRERSISRRPARPSSPERPRRVTSTFRPSEDERVCPPLRHARPRAGHPEIHRRAVGKNLANPGGARRRIGPEALHPAFKRPI